MLSGNGRHRRPRQAPAFLVAAGVTGAGVALPLLGAGAASAVEGETWDRVAECESDGNWLADGENGYYGGLQLPLSMWQEFGGEEFADRPDLASRTQQIAVAERVLAERGPRAFPACALSSGLTAEHRAERNADREHTGRDGDRDREPSGEQPEDAAEDAAEDTAGDTVEDAVEEVVEEVVEDVTDAPDGESGERRETAGADESGETGTEGESGKPENGRDAEGATEADGSGGSGGSGGDAVTDEVAGEATEGSGGKHRGRPAPGEAERAEDPAAERGSGRHAAEGRDATGGRDGGEYRVLPGDSLHDIAGEQGVPGGWPALYELNAKVVGEDPDHILPGQLLDLQTAGAEN
jgi:hypothetical protein